MGSDLYLGWHAVASLVLLGACSSLRSAPLVPGGDDQTPTSSPPTESPITPPDETDGADAGPSVGRLTYDAAQRELIARRVAGPTTAQGSRGYCASNYFFWRDGDGALHAWSPRFGQRVDYAFSLKASSFFAPSDAFIPAPITPLFQEIAVYQTTSPDALIARVSYAPHVAATDQGILLLDQHSDLTSPTHRFTRIRHWLSASNSIEDVVPRLETLQPPTSFGNDELVVPSRVDVPHALWIVNIAKKATTSVTFDGGLSVFQTWSSEHGLFVWYTRNGGRPSLRLYRDNRDDAAARLEIGDELANSGPIFEGGPEGEHAFLAHIALAGDRLVYGSRFGIFSYNVKTGALTAFQLAPDKTVFPIDTLCVLRDANVLVYRRMDDTLGQIWAIPLDADLPRVP